MAQSSVASFLGKFDGGARPNRYRVTISGAPVNIPQTIQFLCKASSIPASTLGVCEVAYMGRVAKISGDKTYDDWSVTVYNNISFDLRKAFERWMDGMLAHEQNIARWQDDVEYQAIGTVEQLDRKEKVIATYDVKGIFPTSVGEIALAYDTNNTVEEFPVTFAVNWWESDVTS